MTPPSLKVYVSGGAGVLYDIFGSLVYSYEITMV